MLAGFKMSSLPCKCVIYRPEHNAKEGLHDQIIILSYDLKNLELPFVRYRG